MYTENYEQEIDLKDLFFAVLYRWRVLLLAAVLGACILGGYKGISGGQSEEQNVPEGLEQEAEQYDSVKAALEASIINLEITIEAQNHYITEAPIMQINPYNEAVASAELLIQSNELENGKIKNLLNGYEYALLNGSYLKEAAADVGTEPRYLKELLRVEQKEINGEGQEILWNMQSQEPVGKILSVWAVGEDKQEAEELLSAVLEETEAIHQKLEAEIGTHDVLYGGRQMESRLTRIFWIIRKRSGKCGSLSKKSEAALYKKCKGTAEAGGNKCFRKNNSFTCKICSNRFFPE